MQSICIVTLTEFYSYKEDVSGEVSLESRAHKSHRSDQPFAKLLSDNYLSTNDKMHIIDMMNSNRQVLHKNYRHHKRSPPATQQVDEIDPFNDFYDEVNDDLLYGSSLASQQKAESGKNIFLIIILYKFPENI